MSGLADLEAEILALTTALGLTTLNANGSHPLNSSFFADPLTALRGILSNASQREGLLQTLDAFVPAVPPAVLDGDGAQYHPLLAHGGAGQLYLKVTASETRVDVGLGAELRGAGATAPALTAEVPLVRADGGLLTVLLADGAAGPPLKVALRVPMSNPGGAITGSLLLGGQAQAGTFQVELTQPARDGSGPQTLVLDPLAGLRGAAPLLAGVLEALGQRVATPEPVLQALPALLGLAGGLRPLPLSDVTHDPAAMRGWLKSLALDTLPDGRSAIVAWLTAIGQLFDAGATGGGGGGSPSESDPLRLVLVNAAAGVPGVALTAALRAAQDSATPVLVIGVRIEAHAPAVDTQLFAEITLLAMPLSGTAPATVIERIDLAVTAPAGGGQLLPSTSTPAGVVAVGGLRAGVRYQAGAFGALLEMTEVVLAGQTHPRLDLLDARSLTAALTDDVIKAIRDGISGSASNAPADALLTLLGLTPGASPAIDLALLATAPTRALADYFSRLRATPAGWTPILSALGTLLGNPPGTALTGSGSATDPWLVSLTRFTAPAGALPTLSLALWDAAPAGAAGPMLRLGLALAARAEGTTPPWKAAATAALLGVDLPAGGVAVQWLGELDAELSFTPPSAQPGDVLALKADEVAAQLSWRQGAPLAARASVRALTLSNGPATVALGDLALPPPGGFDPNDPALGFAAGAEAVWAATRLLLARVAGSWGGPAGTALAALLGLATPGTLGLPPGLPPLAPPVATDVRSLLRDPLHALGNWLGAMLADSALTAEGAPLLDTLRWPLQALLTDTVPLIGEQPPYLDVAPAGYGTARSPWTVPLQAAGSPTVELLCWLDPDGPPAGWAVPALTLLGQPPDTGEDTVPDPQLPDVGAIADAVSLLAPYLEVPEWALAEPGALGGALGALDAALAGTDGVVPADAAQPAGDGWTAAPVVIAAHHRLPRAPDAITAVLGEIDRLTAGIGRDLWSVLLIAPALAGAGCWDPLLSQAGVSDAAPVDLAATGSDPAAPDLSGLAAAGYYVLDFGARSMALRDAVGRLKQAVAAVRRVKPAGKVVLVAHSYLGVAATQFHADLVAAGKLPTDVIAGLITLGAPLAPVSVPAFAGWEEAEGLRWVQRLAPNGLPGAPSLEEALDHLAGAVDTTAAARAEAGVATEYPVDAFQWAPDPLPGLGGVGALALAGQLETSLGLALAGALAQSVAHGDSPTGLGYGARVELALPAPADEPKVEVTVRLDVGTLALLPQTSAPLPPRVVVTARLWEPQGWLVGDAGGGDDGTRLRAAEVIATIAAGSTELSVRLDDVAHNGVAASAIELSDPLGPAVFAKLLTRLQSAATQAPAGRCAALLDVIEQLDLVPKGGAANADAFGALLTDPRAYLGPRMVPLLDRGALGLSAAANVRPGSGPWTLSVDLGRGDAQRPAQLVIEPTPWRVTLRTDPSGDGLHTAADGRASATMTVRLGQPLASVHGSLTLLGLGLSRDPASGASSLSGPWFDAPLTLVPADPATLEPVLARSLARLLIDAAVTVVAERHFHGALIGSLSELVARPAAWLQRDGALGSSDPAAGPISPAAMNRLLGALARAGGLTTSDAAPLELPGGLVLSASAAGGGPSPASAITMALAAPLPLSTGAGTEALALHDLHAAVTLDRGRHVTIAGGLTLHIPLPGGWKALDLTLAAAADGLHLGVTLDPAGSPISVTLLPRVTGVDKLLTQLTASLLTDALNALVEHIPTASAGRKIALDAATTLGLYTQAAGFNAAKLAALTTDLTHGNPQRPPTTLVTALSRPLSDLLNGSGITISSSAKALSAAVTLSGLGPGAHVDLSADFAPLDNTPPAPPTLTFALAALAAGPAGSPFLTAQLDASCSWPGHSHQPTLAAAANLGLNIDTGLGVVLRPALGATLAAGELSITFLPVPADAAAAIELAPAPGIAHPDQLLVALAEQWAAPIAAALLLTSGGRWLDHPLWQPQAGGAALTARTLLKDAQLLTTDGQHIQPVPTPGKLLQGLLGALASFQVPLGGTLALALDQSTVGAGASRYGLRVTGEAAIAAGDYAVTLGFGLPTAPASIAATLQQLHWGTSGVAVTLVELAADGKTVSLMPALALTGFGLRMARSQPAVKLIDTSAFGLGAAAAYLETVIDLTGVGAPRADPLRGAVILEQVGLPFLSPAAAGDQDPVVSSLLAPGSGDQSATNPPVDLIVGTAAGSAETSSLMVLLNDQADSSAPIWFPVHRAFGPVYIDQIGLAHPPASHDIDVDLDASVALAGLTVTLDNLAVAIPLDGVARPAGWHVTLDGLGIQFAAPDVFVEGSLARTGSGGSVEYDGSLAATVAGRGFSALGGFSHPSDGSGGSYLSLFAFVSVNAPLGGPPFFFVLAVAGGAGYNRQLIVPTDPLAAPSFPLVAALIGGPAAGGPQTVQQALAPLRNSIPARRGSYWVAAGVRFTTFELLNTTALIYVALDRGVEVGVLGVSRLVLPQQDLASASPPILNAELAVNARYDSTAQILSVRAQLTDHSWLLSKDCQLTGGFAFVVWFGEHRFVFTLGGYAPTFTPASDLPVVPRVGFHWAVSDTVTVKGESYFALLPSCVMLGGRLEASYASGAVAVWFIAWLDVLVSWDPFFYHVDLGVSIGARFTQRVCVIWCVTIDIEVSLGASVTIDGPPLHGTAHVDLAVASVHVQFGHQPPSSAPYLQHWGDFAARYLSPPAAAAPTNPAAPVAVHVASGTAPTTAATSTDLHPPSPPRVLPSFSVRTESRIPVFPTATVTVFATSTASTGTSVAVGIPGVALPAHLTLIPFGNNVPDVNSVEHSITIRPLGSAIARPAGISANARTSGFATGIWLHAPSDAVHAPSDGGTLTALGGVDIIIAPELGPPVAKLSYGANAVEVHTSPALPFAATTAAARSAPAHSMAPPAHAQPARTANVPWLRAVVGHAVTGPPARLFPPLDTTAAVVRDLEPATSTVWDFPAGTPATAVQLSGRGEARLTCLTAGGYPLWDRVVAAGSNLLALPRATARLVASPADPQLAPAAAGWQATTRLVQIGPATLLGPDAVVLASGRLPAAAWRPAHLGPVAAHRLLPDRHSRTVLPADIELVLVLLDPAPGAEEDPDDGVRVLLDGAPVASSQTAAMSSGPGTHVRVYQHSPGRGDQHLTVGVATGDHWQVAGVVGLRGASSEHAAALLAFPQQRLLADLPVTGSASPRLHLIAVPPTHEDSPSIDAP